MSKKISLRQKVFLYIKNNPNCTNEQFKAKFKGESWNSLKTYRNQFWKQHQKNDISGINSINSPSSNGVITGRSPLKELTPDSIKTMIQEELNKQVTPQMLRVAIEYISKLQKEEAPVPELDMSKFYLIGDENNEH
jgi:hypothetical protein